MAITIPVGLDTDALDRQLKGLEDKASSAGKAIGDSISKGAKKAEKSADDAAKGLEDLGDAAGLPVDKLKKLAGGFAALSNPVTIAVVGIGAVALGMVAAAAGIVSVTQEAEKLAEALKPLRDQEGFGISKASLAAITAANDAMRALGAVFDQLVVSMGAEFAPTVERVATLLVKLGLMALDAFNAFASGHDVLHELAVFLVDGLIGAMTGVVTSLMGIVETMADVARAAGQDGLAGKLDAVSESWSDFKTELAEGVVDALSASFVRAKGAVGSYDERAKALIGSMKLLGQAHKDTKADVDDLSTSVDSLLEGWSAGMGLVGTEMVLVQQEVDAAVADIVAGVESVGATAEASAEKVSLLGDSLSEKVTNSVGAVQGGLEGIATLIGGPVAGAIAGLILNLSDTVGSLISQIASIPDILTSIPELAVSLVQAIVDAIPAIVSAIPVLIDGLIDAIPTIITSLIVGLIAAMPSLIETSINLLVTLLIAQSGWLAITIVIELVKALVVELPKVFADLGRWLAQSWKRFVSGDLTRDFINLFKKPVQDAIQLAKDAIVKLKEGVQKFFQYWLDAWKEILTLGMADTSLDDNKGKGWDLTKEILTLGLAETKSYGDAPSMQRAGPQGANVRTSPGDYFLAGRNPQALLQQALQGAFGAGPAPAMAGGGGGQVNMAFQHRAFDGFFVTHAALGGQTSGLFKTVKASKDARGM